MAQSRLIAIRIEDLLQKGQSLDKLISDLNSLNARLDTLITQIGDSWTGDASEAYITRMRNLSEQAKGLVDVISEFKGYAVKAANEFDTADKDGASIVRGCF